MTDRVLIDGDEVEFSGEFGKAKVSAYRVAIRGSGKVLVNKKKVCLEGDETTAFLECDYETSTHNSVKGRGVIRITPLKGDDHISKILVVDGRHVLLKGGKFDAVFTVSQGALSPPPSLNLDTTLNYEGKGEFVIEGERKWQSN